MQEFNNITEILERNAREWPADIALVEINPQELESRHTTWREFSLMQPSGDNPFRSDITPKVEASLRNLIDMSHQRCCKRAYWEFQQLMTELKQALSFYSDEWKILIEKMSIFVPKCIVLGHCPEKNGCANSIKAARKEFDFSKYLETMELSADEILRGICEGFKNNLLIPVFCG